jgi:hypothetical protein
MSTKPSPSAEALIAGLCGPLQVGAQLAEAPMRSIDSYIEQLNQSGLLYPTLALGTIVMSRSYGMHCQSESNELIQAAVSTKHGTAAVYWDSEDYMDFEDDPDFEAEALIRTRPLRECPPAIRSLVWPQINGLLMRVINSCRLRPEA